MQEMQYILLKELLSLRVFTYSYLSYFLLNLFY